MTFHVLRFFFFMFVENNFKRLTGWQCHVNTLLTIKLRLKSKHITNIWVSLIPLQDYFL